MARIADRKPRDASGGYERLFGAAARVQSIPNLDEFLAAEIMPEGVFIAPKRQVDEIRLALKGLMKIGNGRNFV